jgi:ribosomal protein L37AE/L43A
MWTQTLSYNLEDSRMQCSVCGSKSIERLDYDAFRCNECQCLGSEYNFRPGNYDRGIQRQIDMKKEKAELEAWKRTRTKPVKSKAQFLRSGRLRMFAYMALVTFSILWCELAWILKQ